MERQSEVRHGRTLRVRAGALVVGLICAIDPLCAAENAGPLIEARARLAPRHKTPSETPIRVDVKLTLIPVTVTDPLGASFSGLPGGAFRLFEDGVEQKLKYFSSEDAPVSLGVVFDASRSMTGRLDQSRAAVSRFFHSAMPGDEFFL